jgi:hypothetical protein
MKRIFEKIKSDGSISDEIREKKLKDLRETLRVL